MTTWKDIISKPGWSDLDLATKQEVRNQWIQEDVAPTLASDPDREAVLRELYDEPLDTGEGLARSMFSSAARGALDPLAAIPEVAGAFTGIESLEEFGGDIRSGIESAFPVNPAQQGFLTDAAGALGQVGQIIGTSGLGTASGLALAGKAATKAAQAKAASLGAKAAVQTTMGSSAVAGGLERAEQLGLEGNERLIRGLLAGSTELATEKLGGFATELGPVQKYLGESIESGFMQPIIRGVTTEAAEEGVAEAVGQATDLAMTDKAPAMDLKQIGYSMLLGGVGGAAFGGIEAAVAPKTAQAYKETGAYTPVRNSEQLPPEVLDAAQRGDDSRLVTDKNGRVIGYKPAAATAPAETVEAELPIEVKLVEPLEEELKEPVAAMVDNVIATPTTTATAAALAEDVDSASAEIVTNEESSPKTVTEGSGIVTDKQIQPEIVTDTESVVLPETTQAIEAQQDEQPTPTETDAVESVESVSDAVQPEVLGGAKGVEVPTETQATPEEAIETAWQSSPEFAAAEEAAMAGDEAAAEAIEAGWRDQQKVTKDVAETGAKVDGDGMRNKNNLPPVDTQTQEVQPPSVPPENVGKSPAKAVKVEEGVAGGKPSFREPPTEVMNPVTGKMSSFQEGSPVSETIKSSTISEDDIKNALRVAQDYDEPAFLVKQRGTTNYLGDGVLRVRRGGAGMSGMATFATVYPDGRVELERNVFRKNPTQQVSPEPTGAVPTESLPERQPTLGSVGEQGGSNYTKIANSDAPNDIETRREIAGIVRKKHKRSKDDEERLIKLGKSHPNYVRAIINSERVRGLGDTEMMTGATLDKSESSNDRKHSQSDSRILRQIPLWNATQPPQPPAPQETKPQTPPPSSQPSAEETGDAGVTDAGNLETGIEIEFDGEVLKVLGYEEDGRIAVQNRTGGWLHLPKASKVKVLAKVENPYSSLVSDSEEGFDFLNRLKLTKAPKGTPITPSGSLPRGTRYFRGGNVGTGQSGRSGYAITPDGLLYEDTNRSMTHGGMSPYTLRGKIGLDISKPGATGGIPVQAAPSAAQASTDTAPGPFSRLTSYISTLPAKAQAAWTPERLAAAESFYSSGDAADLEPLTATQRKIVTRNRYSEAEQDAYEAEQKRQFALRNPKAAEDVEKLANTLEEIRNNETRILQSDAGTTEQGGEGFAPFSSDDTSFRAKAVQRGMAGLDWANMGAEQRRKALLDFMQTTARSLRNNSVGLRDVSRIVQTEKGGAYARNVGDRGALSIEIEVSPNTSVMVAQDNPEVPFSVAYSIVEEELMHAVHLASAFKRWKAEGSIGNFNDWFIADSVDNLNQILDIANRLESSGDTDAANKIKNIVGSAAKAYWSDNASAMLADLENRPVNAFALYLEAARMLAQVSVDDFITEGESLRFYHAVKRWIRDVIDTLKESLNLVKSGALGEALKRDVDTLASAIREMRQTATLVAESQKEPPAATYADLATDPNALINSLSENELQQALEVRENAVEPSSKKRANVGEVKAIHYSRKPLTLSDAISNEDRDNVFGNGFYAMEPNDESMWLDMVGWSPGEFRNEVNINPRNPLVVTPDDYQDIFNAAKSEKEAKGYARVVIDGEIVKRMESGGHDAVIIRGFDADETGKLQDKVDEKVKKEFVPKFESGKTDGRFTNGAERNAIADRISQDVAGVSYESLSRLNEMQNQVFVPAKNAPSVVSITSDNRRQSILRQNDGAVVASGVNIRNAEAARNSYDGVIPGVAETWLGTVAEFQEQFPDGIDWGDGKKSQPRETSEAGVAADGRSYIFTDRVQVLEGDVKRAAQYFTTPSGEAVKRLLRHESFGHRGVMSLPFPIRTRFLNMIASGVMPEAELDYLVNKRGYTKYSNWRKEPALQVLLAEEWLAHKMEGITAIPQSGAMAQMLDWLRDVWRWLTGGEKPMLPELRDMMREMHKALGALKPEQRVVETRASLQQSQQDTAYFAAIDAGDMVEAQRIVDMAARAAGYTERYNHGTPNTDFTVFNLPDAANTGVARMGPGIYGAVPSDTQTTETYARKGRVIPMYVSMENVVIGDQLSETQVADMLSVLDADMTLRDGNKVAKFIEQYKGSDSLNELWGLFQSTQPEKWYDAVNKAGIEGATRFSAGVENGEIALFKQNKIKDASPITRDSSGAIIPPSQRFQSASNDIRYSLQQPIAVQVGALTSEAVGVAGPRHPMAFEEAEDFSYMPAEYRKMADDGKVGDALQGYAIETVAPYATSKAKLLELQNILSDDRKILEIFGIGATKGQSGLGYLFGEAALQAEKLGAAELSDAFAFGRKAVGTSKGQGLVGEKFFVNDPRYQPLFRVKEIDALAREEQRNIVNAKLGETTAKAIGNELETATEEARDNVADAIPAEILISEKVLELGAAVQGNPKLSERIKKVIGDVLKRGILLRAMERLKGQGRASIIPDSDIYDNMTLEQMEAELARLDKSIADDIDFVEKEVESGKEKTPTDVAKKIIKRIINKNKTKKEREKGEPDQVELLYKQDLKAPMEEADFVEKAKSVGVDEATALELKNAIDLEITANSLRATLSTLGGDIEQSIKKANDEANKFQKQAERIIDKVVDRMADPPLVKDRRKKAKDPIQEAYRSQVKAPVSREQFIAALEKINVFEQTSSLLFDAAAMEKVSKEAIASARKLKSLPTPTETAKQIINRVQKKSADSTAKQKPKLDRVRLLYKSHLREHKTESEFLKDAKDAGLDEATAKKLYDSAELEIASILLSKEVRGKSENYDKLTKERLKYLDVDSSALVEYINMLRREGKLGAVTWRDIMQLPATRQQVVKGTLLELVKQNPELQNLSAAEQETLADALERVWEKERERQFKLQVKRMEVPGAKDEDVDKVVAAVPRIIKLINQGMLAEDAFYESVGEQYGITKMNDADRKRVTELAEKIQDDTMSRADKAQYARELVNLLQKNHKLTAAEILSNVWVSHVLSGVRTQFDMAFGILNGLFSTIKKAGLVLYKNKNIKGVKGASRGVQQFFAGMVDGINEAIRYVRTEEPGLIDSDIEFVSSYFDGGVSKGGISTARKLRQSESKIMRALGTWLSILERVNTAWDVVNYRATLQGTLAMAHQLNPKIYKESLMPTKGDFAAMEARAKVMLGAGATRAQITARTMSYITDGIHLLSRNLDAAEMRNWKAMSEDFRYDAKEASYMVDPTGLGGQLYRAIMGAATKLEKAAKKRAEDAEKQVKSGKLGPTEEFAKRIFPPLLYVLSSQARNLAGVRFIRFTGNKINELISFIPLVGLSRIYMEEGMRRDGELTIKGMSVMANQALAIAFAIPALIKALYDLEDDDEERGYIVQGPWDNLTPARKSQLMADGFKPNTIAFYDKETGKWTSFNYINWPSAGWLATLGSVSDYRRYTPEKWNEKTAIEKLMSGIYAGGSSFMDISSISQMAEIFGRSTYSTDPSTKGIEKITKTLTGYAGGFMPRLFKDIDSWMDNSAYRPESTFDHLAKEVPYLRRSAGAPVRDIFYERVEVSRTPWSRAMQQSPDDPAYKLLGKLNAKGIWLTPPNPENRKVRSRTGMRSLTEDEAAKYMSTAGGMYKDFVLKRGKLLSEMNPDKAEAIIEKTTARIREYALKKAIARAGTAVTIDTD